MTINVLPVNQNFNDHGYGRNILYCEFGIPASTYYNVLQIQYRNRKKMPGMYIAYSAVNHYWSIRLIHKRVYVLYYMYCLQDFFLSFKICTSHHNILCIFLFKDYALESIVSFPISVASFSIWYSFNFISIFI